MESDGSDLSMINIPLAKPYFDETEILAVNEVLASGMVSQGKKVEEFEEQVRRYVGAKYAIALNSCTSGLYLATRSKVDLWNTRIAIPAFTFPAAQNVVKHFGGEMSIEHVDVDKKTYNINVHHLNQITRKPRHPINMVDTIIPIHQFGLPCDMDSIEQTAQEHDMNIIEDAACALGSTYKGEQIGKRGTAVFSFHGRKIITTGEGGMVVTDNEELYEQILEARQHGRNSHGEFMSSGLNFKMSDIHAAIGIAQMEKLDSIIAQRKEIAFKYWRKIHNPSIWTPNIDPIYSQTNWQSYVVRLSPHINRDSVITKMKELGIETQIGSYDNSKGTCETSDMLAKTTIALPIWPGMTNEIIQYITDNLDVTINGPTKTQEI